MDRKKLSRRDPSVYNRVASGACADHGEAQNEDVMGNARVIGFQVGSDRSERNNGGIRTVKHIRGRRPDADLCEFGKWLRGQLDKKGLQQKDLQPVVSLGAGAISCWMIGVSKPRRQAIVALAKYFRTTTDEIHKYL